MMAGANRHKRHVRVDGSCQVFTFKPGGLVHIVGSLNGPKVSWCGRKTSQKNPSMKIIQSNQIRPILDLDKFCRHCFEARQTVVQGEFERVTAKAYL